VRTRSSSLETESRSRTVAVCTVYMFEAGLLAEEHVYLDEGRLRHQLSRATPPGQLREE
jgi:hypothetical protein